MVCFTDWCHLTCRMQLAASTGTNPGPSLRRTSAAAAAAAVAAQIALAGGVTTAGGAASVQTEALKGQRGAVQGKTGAETGSFTTFVLLLFNVVRMLCSRNKGSPKQLLVNMTHVDIDLSFASDHAVLV